MSAIARAAYGPFEDRFGVRPAPLDTDYGERIEAAHVDVLCREGDPVGFVITVVRPDDLLLENVAVHPDHQGHGHGRRLIAAAEAQARTAGRDRIVLYTHAKMTENRALYGRYGFAEVEERLEAGLERIYMVKMLG